MAGGAKRALITGGTGFVGANLARRLLDDGHRVHLVVRPGYTRWRLEGISPGVGLHEVDLEDDEGLRRVVAEIAPEWVFHLATHGAYSSQTDLRRMVATNMIGTINLVQACLGTGFEAFVNTGSSSEYGFKSQAPSESAWLEPNSHYAVTKAAATLFCRYTAQSRDVHMPTLRLYSVFGPFEEPTRLIPTLIVQGLRGHLPPRLVSPNVARDFIFVDDVIDAYVAAATCPGQERGAVYNVGTGTQTSLREVVDVARRVLAVAEEPLWNTMSQRQWDTTTWVADNQRIRRVLSWSPRQTLEDGFTLTAHWFRSHPALLRSYEATVLQPQ